MEGCASEDVQFRSKFGSKSEKDLRERKWPSKAEICRGVSVMEVSESLLNQSVHKWKHNPSVMPQTVMLYHPHGA